MKFIRFIAALTAVLAILNTFSVNSFAEDTQELEELTVDEATQKAITYSSKLKTLSEDEQINEQSYDDSVFQLRSANEHDQYTSLAVKIKELLNGFSNNKVNTEIEKESIKLSVIEFFAEVINAEDSLEQYENQIEVKEKELKVSEVKLKQGKISQTDYDNEKLEYDKLVKQKEDKQTAINSAFYSLNKVLGTDLNKKYNLVLDAEYTPLEEVDLETYILKAKSNAQSLVEKSQEVEIAKYKLDRYAVLYSEGSKESMQNNYAQSVRNLNDAKTTLETNIRTLYSNIKKNEADYETALKELEKLEKDYEILEKKYSLGKTTQIEVENALLSINSKKAEIKQLTYEHYTMKMKFENVNLI